jgi:hypothetical protein
MAHKEVFAHMIRASKMRDNAWTDQSPALHRAWWNLDELGGRLAELSGRTRLTMACTLVREAQQSMIPVAWISATPHTFFPPDMAHNEVDLDALPVIWVPDSAAACRAADWLIRSSAFGLIIIDLGSTEPPLTMLQGRLAHMARNNDTAVLFLTEKDSHARSLSSMITLRGQSSRLPAAPFQYVCEVCALKDKRRGPGWKYRETFYGPAGLR